MSNFVNSADSREMPNSQKHLMNPATGSVDTDENWQAESSTWEGDQRGQLDSLVEVQRDSSGQWVEV